MPEIHFVIRWPDGRREVCYSPSTIIVQRMSVGTDYRLDEFVAIATAALEEASDRVRALYGMGCGRAMQQIKQITAASRAFRGLPEAIVHLECFEP